MGDLDALLNSLNERLDEASNPSARGKFRLLDLVTKGFQEFVESVKKIFSQEWSMRQETLFTRNVGNAKVAERHWELTNFLKEMFVCQFLQLTYSEIGKTIL